MSAKKKIREIDFYTGEEVCVHESITAAAYAHYLDITSVQWSLRKRNGVMRNKRLKFEFV